MAISFDTSARSGGADNVLSITPGTLVNGCGVVIWYSATAGTIQLSSMDWGGTNVPIIQQITTGNVRIALCVLANPPSGTQTITATPASGNSTIIASTFSGVNQASPVDSSAKLALAAGTGSPQSLTTTVVAAGSWLVGGTNETSSSTVAGTATIRRQLDLFDSNGTVGTGSQSLQVTFAGTQEMAWVVASIAASSTSGGTLTMMGV